ncbi:MAG: DUF2490 domain-containing protein [Bacteroidota bacterium]|nr:DUF2490 domain-containing protein [Bacteroidota bacterium]
MKVRITYLLPAVLICFCSYLASNAQNTRITDKNTIGWYAYTGTVNINKKWSIHTEYQWRRDNVISDWQQSLLRTGINFKVNQKLTLRAGYAWIETFSYGDIPINGFGKQFTEHRAFQMATVNDKMEKLELSHRFMLEQRWIGRYTNAALTKEDDYFFVNRLRYMYRMQIPLKGEIIADRIPYAAIYDEIFLGFGKNVNENVFDQNRLGVLLGYRFSSKVRIEGGFLSQIVQLPREINNRNVFQYNNGLIVHTIFNF